LDHPLILKLDAKFSMKYFIGTTCAPISPPVGVLSKKINQQLGSIYTEEIPWKQQLTWGLLVGNSSLPKPTPIINKLEYEQKL